MQEVSPSPPEVTIDPSTAAAEEERASG